jgi:hypothetical protein
MLFERNGLFPELFWEHTTGVPYHERKCSLLQLFTFAAVAVVAVAVFFVAFAGSENVVRSTAHLYAPCKFFG